MKQPDDMSAAEVLSWVEGLNQTLDCTGCTQYSAFLDGELVQIIAAFNEIADHCNGIQEHVNKIIQERRERAAIEKLKETNNALNGD